MLRAEISQWWYLFLRKYPENIKQNVIILMEAANQVAIYIHQ